MRVAPPDGPADDDPRRLKVREWLAQNPSPDGKTLATVMSDTRGMVSGRIRVPQG